MFCCRKGERKTNTPTRINNYFTSNQKYLALDLVIKSQFSNCIFVWMFFSGFSFKLLFKTHKRGLIRKDQVTVCKEILAMTKEKETHQ